MSLRDGCTTILFSLLPTVFNNPSLIIVWVWWFECDIQNKVHLTVNVVVIQCGFRVITVMTWVKSNVYGSVLCMLNYYWREYGDEGIDMVMSMYVDVDTTKWWLGVWRGVMLSGMYRVLNWMSFYYCDHTSLLMWCTALFTDHFSYCRCRYCCYYYSYFHCRLELDCLLGLKLGVMDWCLCLYLFVVCISACGIRVLSWCSLRVLISGW